MFSFGNPLGLIALAAIPIILALHFLQQRRKKIRTSTLFLIEALNPRSIAANRLDRLRSSLPLFLQLLAALALAALLSDLRILRTASHQSITVVLDGSASMAAFRQRCTDGLAAWMREISGAAQLTEWSLLSSDATVPPLYRGSSVEEGIGAFAAWRPLAGGHDPAPVLQTALRSPGTRVLFITDRRQDLAEGAECVAFGEPIHNVGFAGVSFQTDKNEWQALVRNFSASHQTRSWWIESADAKSPPQKIALAPGEMKNLSGGFASPRITLRLEADKFETDDVVPLVRPSPRVLKIHQSSPDPLFTGFVASLHDAVAEIPAAEADLLIGSTADQLPPQPTDAVPHLLGAILHLPLNADKKAVQWTSTPIAEGHPLTRDLDWRGLVVTEPANPLAMNAEDRPLLWIGTHPVIFLRQSGALRQLILNFNPAQSTSQRHPSIVLLLHRFAEEVRGSIAREWAANFETSQQLGLSANEMVELRVPGEGAPAISEIPASADTLRAPAAATFFEVTRTGGEQLLISACHFSDPRESDLSAAASSGFDPAADRAAQQEQRTPFLPPAAWLLGSLACAFAYWTHPWRWKA